MGTNNNKDAAKTKKIIRIVLNVLLWIFLVFAFIMMVFAFASISNDYGVPMMGNKVILNVVSNSMQPTINKGDLIAGTTLTLEEKQALKEGDIITFFVDLDGDGIKEINTHRIVKVNGTGDDVTFRTKGDNSELYPINVFDDRYNIRPEDVICTWKQGDTQLKGLGSVMSFLQSRVGFLCIVIIPLALFFIYEVVRFVLTVVKVKGEGKRVITAEDEEEIRRKAVEDYLRKQEENKDSALSEEENK